VQYGYGRSGFGGYLGNVGLNATSNDAIVSSRIPGRTWL
jgi:hypothetical protein